MGRLGMIGRWGLGTHRFAALSAFAVAGLLAVACESGSDEAGDDAIADSPTDDAETDEASPADAATDDAETDDAEANDEPTDDDSTEASPADDATDEAEADDEPTDDDSTDEASDDTPTGSDSAEPSEVPESPATPTESVMIECEELTYAVTCDDLQPSQGYYACSDYFGVIQGVKEQCSAGPTIDVREGPPCGEYEFLVGSCIYYNEAVSDRCYITHVGAESADLVEAGRTFWEFACAGTWVAPD